MARTHAAARTDRAARTSGAARRNRAARIDNGARVHSRSARHVAIASGLAVAFTVAAPAASDLTAMPGPSRGAPPARHVTRKWIADSTTSTDAASASQTGCVGCHATIADEWSASMHHHSYDDPVYQRALAKEPTPFCRKCHAPEADPARDPPSSAAAIGVACITCHVPQDSILGAPRDDAKRSPHAVVREARFAVDGACASCHEFAFSDARKPAAWMQSTVAEHARSEFADASCASCHMPWTGEGALRHRSHAFASTRSHDALARAISVKVRRDGSDVVFDLALGQVGHAFPTGDLFRRLALIVDDGDKSSPIAVRYLAKHFRLGKTGPGLYGKTITSDDRVTGPTVIALDASASAGHALRWRVIYQRIEHPIGSDESKSISAEDVLLAQGTLDAR